MQETHADFRVCVALLLLVSVASKCGDALAPSLLDTWRGCTSRIQL
jgi:hypothetical protein